MADVSRSPYGGEVIYSVKAGNLTLGILARIAEDPNIADLTIDVLREYAEEISSGKDDDFEYLKLRARYDYVKKTKERGAHYKIKGEEANVVRLIFSLYLQYKSTAEVVRELAKRKVKTRNGSIYWSKGTIHRILRNECYIGRAYYSARSGLIRCAQCGSNYIGLSSNRKKLLLQTRKLR
jgi:hypothetical protein